MLPGFYAEGKFGIRIENIMLVQKHKSEHQMGAGITLLEFEPLTLIPFQVTRSTGLCGVGFAVEG